MSLKRFLLFAGYRYTPNDEDRLGGWEDFKGSYDTQAAAIEAGQEYLAELNVPGYTWAHFVDCDATEIELIEIHESPR